MSESLDTATPAGWMVFTVLGAVWESLVSGRCAEPECQQKWQALLDYCAQDTLGMARLLEVLKLNVHYK